jgi:hypothetical protein
MNGTEYHHVKQIKLDSEGHMAYFLSYSKPWLKIHESKREGFLEKAEEQRKKGGGLRESSDEYDQYILHTCVKMS